MKLILPKALRGFSYDRAMPVEFNSFNDDVWLPSLFFKVVTGGQDRGRNANDPTNLERYVEALAGHPHVDGFEGDVGYRLLNRLTRTSLVQMGFRGQAHRSEQIESVSPYSILAFKPGFPEHASVSRKVDVLVYRMMRDQMRGDALLRTFFERVFGHGVHVQGGAQPGGTYDGCTEIGTLTRLSLCLLDGFQSVGARPPKERIPGEPMPAFASAMARDLQRYLQAYHDKMPVEALTHHFRGLVSVELFIYTLKLFHALPALVSDASVLPAAMRELLQTSAPEIYLDFTGTASGLSRSMATFCVRRDLESIHPFMTAVLTVRHFDRLVRAVRGDKKVVQAVEAGLDGKEGPAYLQLLLTLRDDLAVALRVDTAAEHEEEEIRSLNSENPGDDMMSASREYIDHVTIDGESGFQRLILLLCDVQRGKIFETASQWYRNIGGLTRPYGLLTGTSANRSTWRYAPGNDLLATLVQLAAVDIPQWNTDTPAPAPVALAGFLKWLEKRFGIIVDRPPDTVHGAEYTAAAQENLQAMLRRLRQMGVFRDLSDDVTVQRLHPPYTNNSIGASAP